MPRIHRNPRGAARRWIALAAVAVAAVAAVVYLLAFYSPLAQVTVGGGRATINQGSDRHGGWLGPSTVNFTGSGSGFPLTLAPHAQFTVIVALDNSDILAHTVEGVQVGTPFGLSSTSPEVPLTLAPGEEGQFSMTLSAPGVAGSYQFSVTLIVS